jgi:mono/diheme cytochrome c family protein
MKRYPQALLLCVALTLFGGIGASFAQDVENGRRLSERWCSECHAIGSASGKTRGLPSFAAIANKENVSSEMIASFLLMPHATMPSFPISGKDAKDIAAFIMDMKK